MPMAMTPKITGIHGTFIEIILKSFRSHMTAKIKTMNANVGNFFAIL